MGSTTGACQGQADPAAGGRTLGQSVSIYCAPAQCSSRPWKQGTSPNHLCPPTPKWAEDPDRHFPKKIDDWPRSGRKVAHRHYSSGKCKSKPVSSHFTPAGAPMRRGGRATSVGEDGERRSPPTSLVGWEMGQPLWKTVKELHVELPEDLGIPLLGIYLFGRIEVVST